MSHVAIYRDDNGNGKHWNLLMLGGLAVLAVGCVSAAGWYFSRQNSDELGMEGAIRVLTDESQPENTRCTAAIRVMALARMAIEGLQDVRCDPGVPALSRDATVFLARLCKAAEVSK